VNARTIGAFPGGSLVIADGKTAHDANGNTWIEVRGFDVNRNGVEGWIEANYVDLHPRGAEDKLGRTNPTLAQEGYPSVTVQPGETMSGIARAHGDALQAVEALNQDTILNPNELDPGDQVYLPRTSGDQHAAPEHALG